MDVQSLSNMTERRRRWLFAGFVLWVVALGLWWWKGPSVWTLLAAAGAVVPTQTHTQ